MREVSQLDIDIITEFLSTRFHIRSTDSEDYQLGDSTFYAKGNPRNKDCLAIIFLEAARSQSEIF